METIKVEIEDLVLTDDELLELSMEVEESEADYGTD